MKWQERHVCPPLSIGPLDFLNKEGRMFSECWRWFFLTFFEGEKSLVNNDQTSFLKRGLFWDTASN